VCIRTCRKILGKALSASQVLVTGGVLDKACNVFGNEEQLSASQVLVTGGVLDKACNVFGNEEQLPSLLDTKCRYLNRIGLRCLKFIGHYKVAMTGCSGENEILAYCAQCGELYFARSR